MRLTAFFAFALILPTTGFAAPRPNVVFILTDNHGAWTLGCYGNPDIRTPHIDRLAKEGTLFTNAFSSNAVCSPTRATYLTGLLPSQHGVHCYLGAQEAQMGPQAYSTIAEFKTLPRILADSGYRCGLVGKWHLGKNMEPQEGFRYWITMPHGNTTTFYGADVIQDGQVRKEPEYLTDVWAKHGVKFIEENKDGPFFLMLSFNGPYGLGKSLVDTPRNRHAAYYADKTFPSFPREPMHPWQFNNKEYLNNVLAMRNFAGELSAVDDGVGEILAVLKRLGLDENTLVVFAGDQGWMGGQHGLWGMGDHTRPLGAFDEMLRIPLIYRHPGAISAGVRAPQFTNNYDFLPTMLGYLDLAAQAPTKPASPGRDYSPILRGKQLAWDDTVFYDFENVRAIRTAAAKYVERFPDGPHELYDMKTDPGERFNIYGQPRQVETQQDLRRRMNEFFDRHADKQYDLWHGGHSKTHLLSGGGKKTLTQQ